MRIRLLTSPPLFIHAVNVARMIDISYTSGIGRITATALEGTAPPIYLCSAADCPDAWRAWRQGFPVVADAAAQELARWLVEHQLAERLE